MRVIILGSIARRYSRWLACVEKSDVQSDYMSLRLIYARYASRLISINLPIIVYVRTSWF